MAMIFVSYVVGCALVNHETTMKNPTYVQFHIRDDLKFVHNPQFLLLSAIFVHIDKYGNRLYVLFTDATDTVHCLSTFHQVVLGLCR